MKDGHDDNVVDDDHRVPRRLLERISKKYCEGGLFKENNRRFRELGFKVKE